MNSSRSLDDIISKEAVVFADQIKQAADFAHNEEEIRIEVEKSLSFIQRKAGIKLEGRHEFTVGTGRADSVYDCVIIEYKNPAGQNRLSDKSDASGNRKVVEQLKKRFHDMRTELGRPLNTMLGVGCDGNYFIFVRFRDDKWEVQDPAEVNRYSAERFLWALFNLGTKGKAFTPEYLAGDFGADAKLAQEGIHTLYDTISSTDDPKAQTFFQQWKILFSEICGYDVNSPSDKIRKLGDFYGVYDTPKPAELLFSVHTYYALFMKLLASEIVAFFHQLPPPLQKIIQASTSNRLRREMEELESGSIFRHLNITNFLEGDLFAWYPSTWCEPIEKLVRDMVTRLDGYNPGTLQEDPAGSRDLLKKLYQQLFPKSVRHDLGEYYTPDWLAEHVLNQLEYIGDPDKRLLDPACGSGTFLVLAINRIRKWYDSNRENCAYNEGGLCRKILHNVIGFDLNPLAVMAARTNYLIAIHDLVGYMSEVEIPVYLCDSIMAPAEYGGLAPSTNDGQSVRLGDVKEFSTSVARFLIPTEITVDRDHVAKYAEQLEFCVRNAYSPEEFIERCRDEGLPVTVESLHLDLYAELLKLDAENKNGIWARIIKNAFAPLFIDKVDYVAGNPPWVNWDSLPADYRDSMKPLWQKYGLFSLSGAAGRLGGGKKDLSMLFVYSCVDNYLNAGCRLGFVITQTIFKTKGAGDGFRRYAFDKNNEMVILKPICVDDMSDFQPFEGATNRTAVFVCENTTVRFDYPVPYILWRKTRRGRIDQDAGLESVHMDTLQSELGAIPVDKNNPTSPWLTAPKSALPGIEKAIGGSDYVAHAGVYTGGLNGCYWIRVLRNLPNGDLLIENLYDVGKKKVECVQATIEPDLVYPLLRGRDVRRWVAEPSAHIILAQDPATRTGIPEAEMKRKYPKTYNYFKRFEEQLWQRASSSIQRQMETGAFYSMFAVGSYTLAPWKVMWRYIASEMTCSVVGPGNDAKMYLPDHRLILIPLDGPTQAYYIGGLLNSAPIRETVNCFVIGTQIAPHIIERLAVPRFDSGNSLHRHLAMLSEYAHDAATNGDEDAIAKLEFEIDEAAAQLWGITDSELKAIQEALKAMEKPKRGGRGAN
jgi:hypothetical protein